MKRDLAELSDRAFDLVVIGGGIHGAFIAWDAALRGLSVAVVDRGDWGAATSANSLKVIHGGLRYLQQANLPRVHESIQERSTLLRVAPHLVRPLPFLVPTYRRPTRGRTAFRVALAAVDAIGRSRNRGVSPGSCIPGGRVLDREACLRAFAGFAAPGVTGGALWYDAQAIHPERLTLSVLLAAAERGAVLANYLQAEELVLHGGRVRGVRAVDRLAGGALEIRGRIVVNAAGPWVHEFLRGALPASDPPPALALAINLVSRKPLAPVAVGVRSRTTAEDDPVCGGNRFLFLVPWRRSTLVGTSYLPLAGRQVESRVTEGMLQSLVDECNAALPEYGLSLDDVTYYHAGAMPLKRGREGGRPLALAEHARIVDHARAHRLPGLISVEGVKYTTARRVARDTVDLVYRSLGSRPPRCRTAEVAVVGGEPFPAAPPRDIPAPAWARLCELHGSRAPQVVRGAGDAPAPLRPIAPGSPVLHCEVTQAIRHEMAVKLADVVFRRTDLGTERCPRWEELSAVAGIMAAELGWSAARQEEEISEVVRRYAPLHPQPRPRVASLA